MADCTQSGVLIFVLALADLSLGILAFFAVREVRALRTRLGMLQMKDSSQLNSLSTRLGIAQLNESRFRDDADKIRRAYTEAMDRARQAEATLEEARGERRALCAEMIVLREAAENAGRARDELFFLSRGRLQGLNDMLGLAEREIARLMHAHERLGGTLQEFFRASWECEEAQASRQRLIREARATLCAMVPPAACFPPCRAWRRDHRDSDWDGATVPHPWKEKAPEVTPQEPCDK